MFIYNGKLDCEHASNETITVIFPAGFELNDPVSAYWQWTTDPNLDNKKASVANSSFIRTVTKTSDGSVRRIYFSFDSASFFATVDADFQVLHLTILDSTGTAAGTFSLAASHLNAAPAHSAAVYTGNLKWSSNAQDEMTTIVVPYSVSEGAFFGLYYQWTRDPTTGRPKQNVAIRGKFQHVSPISSDGRITAVYEEGGFRYSFEFDSEKSGSLTLSHMQQLLTGLPKVKFAVAYKSQ